jgi:hypothetical protein
MYQSPAELYPQAVEGLAANGFSYASRSHLGRTCYSCKDAHGQRVTVLIQVRRRDENSRYTIGIALPALKHVELFAGWMQDEQTFYVIPREYLLKIHEKHKDVACYTKEQWRVDFYPREDRLKIQGAPYTRYDISQFAFSNP